MVLNVVMRKTKIVWTLITVILIISVACAEDGHCEHFENESGGSISINVYIPPHDDFWGNDYEHSDSNEKECFWELSTKQGNVIRLMFDDFDLRFNADCRLDYVALYDGSTERDPLLGKFCGSKIPPSVISRSNKMKVVFHSESPARFRASYEGVFMVRLITGVENVERNLTELLLRKRQQERSINKWGTDISKIAIALYLNNQKFFATGNRTGEEIAYELSLQLLSKLSTKKEISTKDLALYINALTVVCIDPKDFFGYNLVGELRKRADKSNITHPFSILTLCNANDTMTKEDVLQLRDQFYSNFCSVWTDTQAMIVMALSCIHFRSDLNLHESILNDMVSELKRKQHKNGTFDTWKTTALVLQGLIAARDYQTDFNVNAAVKFLLDDIGNHSNINDSYYILPILNGTSLASINLDHCETNLETERKTLYDLPVERIQVQISVIAGDDMDFTCTWKIKVPSNYSFYEVLANIGALDPFYKVKYSISDGKPFIVGLANFLDNVEDGKFWFTYSKPLFSTGSLKRIELSPVDIKVNETDEMILWYKSGFWADSEEGSGE